MFQAWHCDFAELADVEVWLLVGVLFLLVEPVGL
jgi:hypothetical protein